jgi:hypothetical protein
VYNGISYPVIYTDCDKLAAGPMNPPGVPRNLSEGKKDKYGLKITVYKWKNLYVLQKECKQLKISVWNSPL